MFPPSASETFCFAPISRYLLLLRFLLPSRVLQLYQTMLRAVNVSSIYIDRPRTNIFYFNCIFTGMLFEMGGLHVNPIRDVHFRGCSRMCVCGGGRGMKGFPLPKICHTYPTMMKLGTVIPYINKTQKIYESRDTPPKFC